MSDTRTVYADEQSAMSKLEKNRVIKEINGKMIILLPPLGIKLWGAVDYLKRCGYNWAWGSKSSR